MERKELGDKLLNELVDLSNETWELLERVKKAQDDYISERNVEGLKSMIRLLTKAIVKIEGVNRSK